MFYPWKEGDFMNAAQIHLVMLHFPIAGVFLGLLFLAWGLLRKSGGAKKAGLALFLISGLTILPVFLSGEGAEEIVENKPLVTEAIIEEHEEAAERAFYITLVLASLALATLLAEKRQFRFATTMSATTLALGIVSAGLLAQAAHLGGMIRHDELRAGSVSLNPENGGDKDEKNDDD